jgi:Protein of unknown function (DUF1279)
MWTQPVSFAYYISLFTSLDSYYLGGSKTLSACSFRLSALAYFYHLFLCFTSMANFGSTVPEGHPLKKKLIFNCNCISLFHHYSNDQLHLVQISSSLLYSAMISRGFLFSRGINLRPLQHKTIRFLSVVPPSVDNSTKPLPGDAPQSSAVSNKKASVIQKLTDSFKMYGWYFVSIYMSLWIGPLCGVYLSCSYNDNFGIDILSLIDYFKLQDNYVVKMIPRENIQPWHSSALIAYGVAEVAEIVRLPLSLYLAPKVKKALSS